MDNIKQIDNNEQTNDNDDENTNQIKQIEQSNEKQEQEQTKDSNKQEQTNEKYNKYTRTKKDFGLFGDRNSTDFPLTLAAGLNKLMVEWKPNGFLKKHQFLPVQFIMNNPVARGLLICHGMGRGKTILAAALAWFLKSKYPKYSVIVLASLTLESNFRNNAKKLLRASQVPEDIANKFVDELSFIPLNSGVMYKKLTKVGKSDEQLQFELQLGSFQTKLDTEVDFLENKILIVDEAHHLFNSITNGSANAIQFYETVMKTRNIKFFPLTGTPIIKHPFEMVPCYNMLGTQPGSAPLLPETMYDFSNMFIDSVRKIPKNTGILTNRIMGLTSYYGSLFEEGTPPGFPHLEPIVVRKVPMSPYQWAAYVLARNQEKDMTASGYLKVKAAKEKFGRVDATSTYRVASRQICNYAFPQHALTEESKPGTGGLLKTRIRNDVSKIKQDDVTREALLIYSPKMLAVLDEIEKAMAAGERRILFYSSFVQTGVNMFAKVLDAAGWKEWRPTTTPKDADDVKSIYGIAPDIEGGGGKDGQNRYVRITGETTPEDRDAMRDHFNATEEIQLVFISGTGTEGLNLLRGRLVLCLEPYWMYDRIDQVIHRFYRFEGHKGLPADQQKVRVVLFLSIVPDYSKGNTAPSEVELPEVKDEHGVPIIKQPTTDEDLWNASLSAKEMNNKFMMLQIETSIDCLIHYPDLPENVRRRIKCKTCNPTHQALFNEDIVDDFKQENPCVDVKETQIKAKELVTDDGTKYYYTFNREPLKIQIYIYDARVGGYVYMQQSHPIYQDLYNKIVDHEFSN